MGADEVLNALFSLGVPGIVLGALFFLAQKFVPQIIAAMKAAKEAEQKAFADRQKDYRDQTAKIVEVALGSKRAVEHAAAAFEENSEVNKTVISALRAVEKSLTTIDRRTENISADVKLLKEKARR